MDRSRFLAVFLLFLTVADVSDASLFWKVRKLDGVAPKDNSTATQITPSPSPFLGVQKSDPKPQDNDKVQERRSEDPQIPNNATKVNSKANNATKVNSNGSNATVSPSTPTANQTDIIDKNHEQDKKTDTKANSKAANGENCDGVPNTCENQKMTACILNPENGSKELAVLVQNKGESTLKVNLTIPAFVENAYKEVEIPEHKSERIKISQTLGKSTKLILKSGDADCVLHTAPLVSEGNYFMRLPSYDKVVTPVNGAYFLLLTVFIFGGTWGCCKFWKRRRQDGVPYQELEMGLPESVSATDLETAEGWDQGWDDDWDEDKAVKSPGRSYVGNISANGLASRSSNRDGWENNWDD